MAGEPRSGGDEPGAWVPRANYGARLEPVDGVLHGAGQTDAASVGRYASALEPGHRPGVFMDYVAVDDHPARAVLRLRDKLRTLESGDPELRLAVQIGLSMTVGGNPNGHYEAAVAAGRYDADIDAFGDALVALGRPVYLRIGYEFNGRWNGYQPDTYQAAFRRVTERLRARSVDVATVWCAFPATTSLEYYPGDAWVDWFGIDLFDAAEIGSPEVAGFLDLADQHRKPVMIGESTPRHVGVLDGQRSWDSWFAPFFDLIHRRKEIKAFHYIDWNWADRPPWTDWGDARIEANDQVATRYREEMRLGLHLHSAVSPNTASSGSRSRRWRATVTRPGARPSPPRCRRGLARRSRALPRGTPLPR